MKLTNRKLFFATILLLLMSGCGHLYTPPERPLAYMFPTVMPGRSLRNFKRCEISSDKLKDFLQQMSLLSPLQESGLQEMEFDTIQRGLARRGYAELDARRTKCCVRWIAFYSANNSILTIVAECRDKKIQKEFILVGPK